MRSLCFVLMPFGTKPGPSGTTINFDEIYNTMIRPAIEAADLDAVRADEEQVGGWIHKPMFERLMMCDYAVADITGGNANVFYELGIRHALRPFSTVVVYQKSTALPFDVAPLRGLPYDPASLQDARTLLAARLQDAREHHDDSPVFQMLLDLPRHPVDHAKCDIFREQVQYSRKVKQSLTDAREMGAAGVARLHEIRKQLGNLSDVEAGTVIDLLLSYRSLKAYGDMELLYRELPVPLQHNRMILEQRAFALNRFGKSTEARSVLEDLIERHGPSPETNGLLGRVYKDLHEHATAGSVLSLGYLRSAIEAYLKGFEADWRDPYPGVNAVSLMELLPAVDPRQAQLLPVVRYAAQRRISDGQGDYWDHVTLLELAVLGRDQGAAMDSLVLALPLALNKRESFAPESTARNLGLIRMTREARGEGMDWVRQFEAELLQARDTIMHGTVKA